MTLEQQVCSLELAKRLKELGVKQESLFLWCNFGKDDWRGPYSNIDGISIRFPATPGPYSFTKDDCWEWCSAFTASELGEMLPKEWATKRGTKSGRKTELWQAWRRRGGVGGWKMLKEIGESDNEADHRAKLLIHLLENKLITL